MRREKEERGNASRYKALRFGAMVLAVAFLTGVLVKACNYLLVDDASSYTRLTLHEFYEVSDRKKILMRCFLEALTASGLMIRSFLQSLRGSPPLTWDPPPRIMTLPIIFSGRRPATTI